jgi:hypothetical protein
MWLNARLLDRLRFEYHFRDGGAARVIAAIRPYQNPDGGFGAAIEPDMRGPVSQPVAVATALEFLDEVGGLDDDMVPGALDYLETITGPDGGLPFVLPNVADFPHAPWWQPEMGDQGVLSNVNPTGAILGTLYNNGIQHPWMDGATRYLWDSIDAMTATNPYEARAVIAFLDHIPDRARAEAAWQKVSKLILDGAHVATDPDGTGKGFSPLHYASRPDTIARSLVSAQVINAYLNKLADEQDSDGGWRFDFPSWTPITTPEWRGVVTLESLITLRGNGRL